MEFSSGQCFLIGIVAIASGLLGWCVRSIYFVLDQECCNDNHRFISFIQEDKLFTVDTRSEEGDKASPRIYKEE